jgi:hypothetical protein
MEIGATGIMAIEIGGTDIKDINKIPGNMETEITFLPSNRKSDGRC